MSVVFFDIEGTLTDKGQNLPPSVAGAIKNLRERGHLAFLATGLSRAAIREDVRSIGFDGAIAAGGTSIEAFGKTILEETIPAGELRGMLPVFEKEQAAVWLEGPEYIYVADVEAGGLMGELIRYLDQGRGIVKSFKKEPPVVNKLTFYTRDEETLEKVAAAFSGRFDVILNKGRSIGEILPKGHNKGTGMDFVLERLALGKEDTYAFGDSPNDIPLLERATVGIAMAEAPAALKSVSDHVAKAPEDDGIAQALAYFGLIDEKKLGPS